MEPVPYEQLPDLLVRTDLVEQIARDEGWEDFHWHRWEDLKKAILAFGTKHLDLIYGGREENPVVAVAAYGSRVGWMCSSVTPTASCPILHAVADVKLRLDEAVLSD